MRLLLHGGVVAVDMENADGTDGHGGSEGAGEVGSQGVGERGRSARTREAGGGARKEEDGRDDDQRRGEIGRAHV